MAFSAAAFFLYLCPISAQVGPSSDNFDAPALNTNLWTVWNPLSDGIVSLNGSGLVLSIPWGTAHDASPSADNTLRVMQPVANTDFGIEVRFQSSVMFAQQREGVIVQQDSGNYLRFDVTNDGTTSRVTATGFTPSVATSFLDTPIASSGPPIWLRVSRSGNNWTETYSLDGVTFATVGSFSLALSPSSAGPFSGNNGTPGITLPSMNAVVDYFFNTASPVLNSDGPLTFSRVLIDPNPPPTTLEKALADIDGDGRLDAVIGFGNPPNSSTGDGIYWYQYPHSGKPQDPWQKYPILAGGEMYEDMVPLDVNQDGAVDIIASFGGGDIFWFENPRGSGGDPRTDPWPMHFIGTGTGENNMVLADIDGDGKLDLVTNAYVFFQNGPSSWTTVGLPRSSNGVTLLDIGSGNGSINVVGMGQSAPFSFVWLENPRETGGNARTGTWQVHVIGPGFDQNGLFASYASADFNGDGRMDVVTADSEASASILPAPSSPIYWWEAPVDRRNGTWIQHTIAPAYAATHNVRTADMDKNGTVDVVAAEQEQSPLRRVTVFYNDGKGNFTPQILSSGSGHSQVVGDTTGSGALDILNAGHGYNAAPHPIELYTRNGSPTVQVRDNDTGSSTTLTVGDSFTFLVTGAAPLSVVNVSEAGWSASVGSTDANGSFRLSGSVGADVIGTWQQTWTVGGVVIQPAPLQFTIKSGTPAVHVVDNNTGSLTTLTVGDSFTFLVTGAAPLSSVNVSESGWSASVGSTDANGSFRLSGIAGSNVVGTWQQSWTVGGVVMQPAPLQFTIK